MEPTLDFKTNQRSKGERRREEILNFAFDLVAKKGVGAFTYEAVAAKFKLSRTHVKYYFHTKDDLLLECFKRVAETGQSETIAAIEGAHSWDSRIHAVVDGAFNAVEKYPSHISILFLFYHYCTVNKKLARVQNHTRELGRTRISAMLTSGKKISTEKAQQIAFEIQMCLTGALLELANTNSFGKLGEYRKRVHRFVDQLI